MKYDIPINFLHNSTFDNGSEIWTFNLLDGSILFLFDNNNASLESIVLFCDDFAHIAISPVILGGGDSL